MTRNVGVLSARLSKEGKKMGIGVSLILVAVGAVLVVAVHVNGHGFNVHTIGIILLVIGAIGALMSMIFWSSWGGFRRARSETTVIER